jgi:hypothetical protein
MGKRRTRDPIQRLLREADRDRAKGLTVGGLCTQRHFNARKARKAYTFSTELVLHVGVTRLCVTRWIFVQLNGIRKAITALIVE